MATSIHEEYFQLLSNKTNLANKIKENYKKGIHSDEFFKNIILQLDKQLYAAHVTLMNNNHKGFFAVAEKMKTLTIEYKKLEVKADEHARA